LSTAPGAIVDTSGTRLVSHAGHWRFTPGQRRGLGVAAARPLYAIATDAATNTVVVGPREALAQTSLHAVGHLYVPTDRADVKIRYRSPVLPARVDPVEGGFRLELDEPAYGVAPGQTAVLYEDDAVVGAGRLVSA
jgi:tRNA-specific 2-thiouridylase